MTLLEGLNARSLTDIANRWGYRGDIIAAGDEAAPQFRGTIHDRVLTSGLKVCTCDTLSIRESRRIGALSRCVMLVCSVTGSPITYTFDDGREIRLDPGMMAFVSAGEFLSMTTDVHAGDRNGLLVIQAEASALADPELADEIARRTRSSGVEMGVAGVRAIELAGKLFRHPLNALSDKLIAESCALELLAQIIEKNDESPAAADFGRIMRVCEYLAANLGQEHHLPALAREAGMSLSSFKTKFLAVTGKTVFVFLTEKRLERALRGMEMEGWSVTQAAWYSGYRHSTNFSSAFRRHFGFSPKDVKRH